MRKKGISLVLLVIVIIVMSILAFAIVISLDDSIDDSKKVAFAVELKEIYDASQEYYLKNREYPIDKTVSYTKLDLLELSSDSQELQNEFEMNQDEATAYYKIEMDKISETGSLYGNEEYESDFYVISEDGDFVYYPLGVEIDKIIYFSLTSKLAQINDEDTKQIANGDVVFVSNTEKITVSKNTNEWTNNLQLVIDTTLKTGEQLYYVIGEVKVEIVGELPYTLELSAESTIDPNTSLVAELSNVQNVIFQKEDSEGKIIAKTTISIENLDITSPEVGAITVNKQDGYTQVKFLKATDDKSGLSFCRYVTENDDYTVEQLLELGNKGGVYSIKVDATVTNVQLVLVDKAGNVSSVQKINIE